MAVSASSDLAYWMEKLPAFIREEVPIIYLAIPGSHNSMTYGIDKKPKLAGNAKKSFKLFNTIFPYVVRRWNKSQSLNVKKQLRSGVRYFDFQISFNESTKEYFFFYGLYTMEINNSLLAISDFLTSHASEVVILDFRDFHRFSSRDHKLLQMTLLAIFEHKVITMEDGSLDEITLNICLKRKQAFIIYRKSSEILSSDFWTGEYWQVSSSKPKRTKDLKMFLTQELKKRSPDSGFITACILGPESKCVFMRLFSSLKSTACKVAKDLHPWIVSQKVGLFRPGELPSCNIFIADFVDHNGNEFCKWVIDLNSSLESGICYCDL